MSTGQHHLLLVPREIRDAIYREYLFIDAEYGYIYDFDAGKLRGARSPPVDELGVACNQGQASIVTLHSCLASLPRGPSRADSLTLGRSQSISP